MSRVSFENYGLRAVQNLSYAEVAGRYRFQARAEKQIVADVIRKLELTRRDDLLEIGCGTGNLLVHLVARVRSAAGIDHPNLLKILKRRAQASSIRLIPGNFLDTPVKGAFSKVLIYSVIHYLSNRREVLRFLEKAARLLRPGGILLVGDIPNVDRKERFLATNKGRKVQKQWERSIRNAGTFPGATDPDLVRLGDDALLEIQRRFRRKGCEAYLLPEPLSLPFAFTREDLIIRKLDA